MKIAIFRHCFLSRLTGGLSSNSEEEEKAGCWLRLRQHIVAECLLVRNSFSRSPLFEAQILAETLQAEQTGVVLSEASSWSWWRKDPSAEIGVGEGKSSKISLLVAIREQKLLFQNPNLFNQRAIRCPLHTSQNTAQTLSRLTTLCRLIYPRSKAVSKLFFLYPNI